MEVPEHTPGAFVAFDAEGRRIGLLPDAPPTFDEWWLAKHGASFESIHMRPTDLFVTAMRELAAALREYVSEMARRL